MTSDAITRSRAVPARPILPGRCGVRIAGTGSALPSRLVTNKDLEALMDTSDEWIVQRTGIRTRYFCDPEKGESALPLSTLALRRALTDAKIAPDELDMVVVGTVSGEMLCPSTACRVAYGVGARGAAAFDVTAACCGFVYGLNIAHEMIRGGAYRTVAVIGCDILSQFIDLNTFGRGGAILFADAAGATILRATDDNTKGILAHSMHADGSRWPDLYLPRAPRDFPPGVEVDPRKYGRLQMNGPAVFKFAVGKFADLIGETLDKAGLKVDDVDQFICHQSNARILEAARERYGIPREKMYVNIDRVGNSSAGSVPLCLDELRRAGRVREGDTVMFVAFGGGLTWASSLWQL